ncbi:hypothetical protein [Neomesorhizobium albiziae]|uniref:hypothetical protein n=1 Tax=Neomesorhizobium albiziae TaxID=335020 RepID=UPI00165F6A5D|nr:hypothetical protein [Mesorhizobium albiziae]
MTRHLAITQRQARTLLRAAEAERGIVEVKIGAAIGDGERFFAHAINHFVHCNRTGLR